MVSKTVEDPIAERAKTIVVDEWHAEPIPQHGDAQCRLVVENSCIARSGVKEQTSTTRRDQAEELTT